MSLSAYWQEAVQAIRQSPVFKGAIGAVGAVLVFFVLIVVLVGIAFLLRLYFKKHEGIDRAYRILVYCLTMTGVVVLLFGAVVGAFLPLMPGTVLLLLAVLLLHRYHRSEWVDGKIAWIRRKIGKPLRTRARHAKRGDDDGTRTHEE